MTTITSLSNNNSPSSRPSPPATLPIKMPIVSTTPATPPSIIKPVVHPLFPPPPPTDTTPPPGSAGHAVTPSNMDQLRLQQIYTLALADRMRFLQTPNILSPFTPPNSSVPHQSLSPLPPRGFPPPPDFSHPLYPYGKFDPRLFRLPEEPKPQHSYIGLISMAILSSGDQKLVLADIYQYILDNFPYFRHRGPGWRNSIRHNLSLNDCFIKAGRAANGKGHYWAIHPACLDDFKKGDYRRRKAQRKVRKHMGLAVDEEDSPSPPPPPSFSPPLLPHGWPPLMATLGLAGPHPLHPLAGLPQSHHMALSAPPRPLRQNIMLSPESQTLPSRKRQFDVASLLGQNLTSGDDRDEEQRISPIATSTSDHQVNTSEGLDVVSTSEIAKNNSSSNNSDKESEIADEEEEVEEEDEEDKTETESKVDSAPGFPWGGISPLEPHQYWARYLQFMQQNHQQRFPRETLQMNCSSKAEISGIEAKEISPPSALTENGGPDKSAEERK